MARDIFREREQAEEAAYFKQQDEVLLERIRNRATLGDIAHAMAAKLKVDDPALLERIAALGITRETAAAFLLAPLVEIAWADGDVSQAEREVITRFAEQRGITPGSTDMAQLLGWLTTQPSRELFECGLDAIKLGLTVLPTEEAHQRATAMVNTCREVAQAAGGFDKLFSLRPHISPHEKSTLAEIQRRLGAL